MTRPHSLLLIAGGAASALTAIVFAGCAGPIVDVRGSLVVAAEEPRLMLTGPAHLLHVDVDQDQPGRDQVTFYRVARHGQSAIDCAIPHPDAERVRSRKALDLDVTSEEGICLAVGAVAGGGGTRVMWHAQRPVGQTFVAVDSADQNRQTP
jgi:hypothetical protein